MEALNTNLRIFAPMQNDLGKDDTVVEELFYSPSNSMLHGRHVVWRQILPIAPREQ